MTEGPPVDQAALSRLAAALSAAREPAEVHRAVCVFLVAHLPVDGVFIQLHDPERAARVCVYAWASREEVDVSFLPPLPMNEGTSSRAIRTGKPALTDHLQRDITEGHQPALHLGLARDPSLPQSSLAVPLVARGQVLGALDVQAREADALGERHVPLVAFAASIVAGAVETAAVGGKDLERTLSERTAELARATDELRRHAVARHLVRHMLRRISHASRIRPEVLRELGRDFADGLHGSAVGVYVETYSSMGLGKLSVHEAPEGRYRFRGEDLLERDEGASQPTCFLALGFLEGAVAGATGRNALGAEVACQSQGHAACEFVIAMRAPLRPLAAEAERGDSA